MQVSINVRQEQFKTNRNILERIFKFSLELSHRNNQLLIIQSNLNRKGVFLCLHETDTPENLCKN